MTSRSCGTLAAMVLLIGCGFDVGTTPENGRPAADGSQVTPQPKVPRVGLLAPEIEGEDIDGVPFKLSDYRGKVVVLDFWGHW